MSYNVVTQEGVRTFENIDDAGDYAQAMSLRTGEHGQVSEAEISQVDHFKPIAGTDERDTERQASLLISHDHGDRKSTRLNSSHRL